METLNITSTILESLSSLRAKRKFVACMFYPGASDRETRKHCEKQINEMITALISGLPGNPTKSFVLSTFLQYLDELREEDTEEREEAVEYCYTAMDIVGIENPDDFFYGSLSNIWTDRIRGLWTGSKPFSR